MSGHFLLKALGVNNRPAHGFGSDWTLAICAPLLKVWLSVVRVFQIQEATGHEAARLAGHVGFVSQLESLLSFGGVHEPVLSPSACPVAAPACEWLLGLWCHCLDPLPSQ